MYNRPQQRNNGYQRQNSPYQNNGYQNDGAFENNPKLRGIDPLKLKIILEIKNKSKNKSMEELLPEIMKINQELNHRNMNFTKQESELLLDAIEESLSPSERQKFNMLKSFL
ncbi:MAG: hypothetical protein NC393_02145 [Clostridium sp.]|nr:hypothetical protein [Clostridium sp.]MCM1170906.1 hypothetical protein [Clostridium sp.]MCM1207340.1 hypothetical protein [Ruminococcus sp.]